MDYHQAKMFRFGKNLCNLKKNKKIYGRAPETINPFAKFSRKLLPVNVIVWKEYEPSCSLLPENLKDVELIFLTNKAELTVGKAIFIFTILFSNSRI